MFILRVALNTPLRNLFDYLPPDNCPVETLAPGQRLQVPFGKGSVRIGIIISISDTSKLPRHKLKKAIALLDEVPLLPKKHLQLIEWVSHYYHHPIGDVVFTSIPAALRQGKAAKIKQEIVWRLTESGGKLDADELSRAKKQLALLLFIKQTPDGVSQSRITNKFKNSRQPL